MPKSRMEVAAPHALSNEPESNGLHTQDPDRHDANSRRHIAQLEAEIELYRQMFDGVVEVCSQAARGDLEARMLHCDDSEKFRALARSINHLLDMTDAFLREAGASLQHASDGKFFRRVLLLGMRGTFRGKSQLINDALDKMARNAASLKEVERLVTNSARMAKGAVDEATEAGAIVGQLNKSSATIGDVVKSISQIAWQTKFLSFNARIEATHAGEAGRGFEVVAQEVKNLAQQTDAATEAITREIAAIAREVERTTGAIQTVGRTIGQMQEVSASIERAVLGQNRKSSDSNL